MKQRPDHLSVSQINTLLTCPQRWKKHYLEGIRGPSSGPLIKGGAFHAGVEAYFHQIINGFQASYQMAAEAFEAKWEIEIKNERGVNWNGADPGTTRDRGLRMLEAYLEQVAPTITPAAVEQSFEVSVPGVPIPLVGYIDLEQTDGCIIDHKTTERSWSQDRAGQQLQPYAYVYAKRQQRQGQLPPAFRFDVIVDKLAQKRNPRVDFQSFTVPSASLNLRWFEELVRAAYQQITIGVFPPNPTGWWCSPTACPAWDSCRGSEQ